MVERFAQAEGEFLPLCYSERALTEAGACLLPGRHRFGWYCARAFAALEGGETAECLRLLRAGLPAWPEMAGAVELLLREVRRQTAPPELVALAEQVKAVLAAYPADDPAVIALKESPAYRRVAYLME